MRSVACVDVHFGNGTRIDYSGLIGSYSSRQGEEVMHEPSANRGVDANLSYSSVGISRRRFMQRAVVVGLGTAVLPSLLAACGGSNDSNTPIPPTSGTTGSTPEATSESSAKPTVAPSGSSATPTGGNQTAGLPDFNQPNRGDLPSPQRLVYAGSRDPDTLDVNVSVFGHVHRILSMVYEPLVYEDRSNGFQPGLATSWEVSNDATKFTFKLRDDVKFHDGTAFDAAAVKFAFDRIVDPATKSKRAINLIGPYSGSEVIDAQTVAITLKEPLAAFLDGISYNFCGIPSPTAVEKLGADFGRQPVATGPMKIKSWTPQDSVVMEKFADYNWASPIFNLDGPAYLDEFVYKIVPEEATRTAVLETGEVDMIDFLPAQDFDRFKSNDSLTVIYESTPGIPTIYLLNTEKAPLDDLNVRKALIHAIDRQEIVDVINYGQGLPAHGPLASKTFAYNKAIEGLYPYDQDKAKSLLEESGWTPGSDGIREKGGKKLELDLLTITSSAQHEFIQAKLKDIGVRVNIKTGTDAWWQQAGIDGEHHLLSEGVSGSDPFVLRWQFHSSNIGTGFARTRFRDARLDQLLVDGDSATDRDKRRGIYEEVQQIVMDNALIIPIVEGSMSLAYKKQIQNVALDARVYYTWFNSTYVSKA